ncbi:metallophosphoesterase [Selenomonadales bacterium OttesenSCG-928-I06]|nr:metallophosphoesterase [Selenomonadales bacterium OttesenSCG-928-I06]
MLNFILFITIYGLINIYITSWFWRNLAENDIARPIVCLIIIALAIGFPIFYRSTGNSLLELTLVRISSLWIVIFIYLFLILLILDISSLLGYAPNKIYIIPIILIFISLIILTGWINARNPVLKEFELNIKTTQQLPQKTFTIAVFADTHLGRINSTVHLNKALNLVENHNLDAVFFLGDIIDDHTLIDTTEIKNSISKLSPKFGTWGILGNHEYISGKIQNSIDIIEKSGIKILRDDWTNLGDTILLIGRDEYSKHFYSSAKRKNLQEITESSNSNLPIIVLDHQPVNLKEAEEIQAILQLSGHTHNGQFWPINFIVAKMFENPHGLSTRGNTNYIVSAGTMTWGPPVRNTSRPEVILVKINFWSGE